MISFKHQFQSAKADGPDSTQVQPSNWNAEHTLTMATARLLGRSTAGTGAVEEISIHSSLMLSAGVLALATNPTVSGNLIVSGTLQVGGTSQFTGAAQFSNNLTVAGTAAVGGVGVASAALDVQSTTKGFLMPRMTTVQRDAIAAPASGLLIFNTTSIQLEVYASGAWRSATGANDIVPVGAVSYFAGTVAPAGWLVCDGGVVIGVYSDLRAYLIASGSPYGTSGADPLLPDLRGEFIRGFDGGRGVDSGRVFGSLQSDMFKQHKHATIHMGSWSQFGFDTTFTDSNRFAGTTVNGSALLNTTTSDARDASAGDETRPRNVALLPCIKAFGQIVISGMAELSELLTAIATQPEAEAGADNTKLMTPLRTANYVEQHTLANDFGWGQTWQDMTASRAVNTAYQNTTGRPISVEAYSTSATTYALSAEVSVDGSTWLSPHARASTSWAAGSTVFRAIVPDGWYYRSVVTGTAPTFSWKEMR